MVSKSLPKKCPNCGNTDLRIFNYDTFGINSIEECEVNCMNCGVIGTINARIITQTGTFILND